MRVLHVTPDTFDDAIREAAEVIRAGRLVAFPTETVYGLGAHALDPVAVARIYAAKGRPGYNPLIVHVAGIEQVATIARDVPERARKLAAALWPGPLTLVLPRRPEVPDAVTAGLDTVGVRVPAHPVALALLREAGVPIAAPSANRSMGVSPTTAAHVARSLGDRVDVILDGGATDVGIESTVVDVMSPRVTVLRPGMITPAEIERVLGEPVATLSEANAGEHARPSPGMLDRHYAPRGIVRLFDESELEQVAREAEAARASGEVVGAITIGRAVPNVATSVVLPREARAYARQIYGALHQLDDAGCTRLFIERVPDEPAWRALADRLARAAR